MKPTSIDDIRTALGGRLLGEPDAGTVQMTGVATNSKELKPGDLFFALVAKRDGHEFVGDAFAAGAAAAVVSRPTDLPPGRCAVLVGDTLRALGNLALWYHRRMPAVIVGVTGSNGKTTTKELLACALSAAGPVVKSPSNFNNCIGVPHTIFQIEPGDLFAVVEMGTSAPGEIHRLAEIAEPAVGVITNIAPTHLEGLGNIKGVALEKSALIESLPAGGVAVLNADDFWSRNVADRTTARIVTYSIENAADVQAQAIVHSAGGIRFSALGREFFIPVLGEHNLYNALAAVAVAHVLELDLELVAASLTAFKLPPMRMQRVMLGGVTIINDAYNANLESMRAALREFARLIVPGRKVLVCGDMLELGEQSEEMHRALGRRIATYRFDLLVAVGEQAQNLGRGAAAGGMPQDHIVYCATTDDAAQVVKGALRDGDTVLLKASRRMALESIIDHLQGDPGRAIPICADAEHPYHTCRAVALH